MFPFSFKNISAPKIFCKPTHEGSCKNWNDVKLDFKHGREYTIDECYELCLVVKECAGFFLSTNNGCSFARKGCIKNPETQYTYYSIDDCRFGKNVTCCT